jgi:hypothetical protein
MRDLAIGGFHTHPDDTAYLSNGDKTDPNTGPIELVIGVTWSKAKKRFLMPKTKWNAYHQNADGRWEKMEIIW